MIIAMTMGNTMAIDMVVQITMSKTLAMTMSMAIAVPITISVTTTILMIVGIPIIPTAIVGPFFGNGGAEEDGDTNRRR